MFDCIVVGAGPAGATAAYHLAKGGHSVLLLEKASLPRYKPCGGGVSPAIAQWFDFDFSPVIDNTITRVEYSWQQSDTVQAKLKDVEPMWMVRRDAFDYYLAQQAQQQGAQVKDATEVTAIQLAGDRWQIMTPQETFEAAYLVAADGGKGPLANWLGFQPRQQMVAASLEVEADVLPEKRHTAYFEFGSLKNGYIWNFPKANGYSISAGFLRGGKGKPDELKKQITNYALKFGVAPGGGQYREYSLNLWTDNQPLHVRKAILAGEAAGILDPLTGEGIRPAIFTGVKAAKAIGAALSGDEKALANYTQAINQEWGSDMVLAHRLAGLFYQFPKIAYKVGVKRPAAAQLMGKILCGELRYSDVTEQAINRIKKSLIPGVGSR